MTGRRLRFLGVALCGVIFLAAAYLVITTDWWFRGPDGRPVGFMDGGSGDLQGDGLGGRIGMGTLTLLTILAFAGMVVGVAAEVWVRHRTARRIRGGEPWWKHT
jgi:hypothetical protein